MIRARQLLITLVAGTALGLPTTAAARPADVRIINTPGNPAAVEITGTPGVRIDPSGNDVDVNSSVGAPVYTRNAPELFGASVSLSASNGAVVCEDFTIPTGRAVQLSTMIASLTGPATPRVWLDFYARENTGWALKHELELPLRSSQTMTFTWLGQLATGFPIFGGGAFDGNGVPTQVRGCIRGPASGATQGNLTITGIYLN